MEEDRLSNGSDWSAEQPPGGRLTHGDSRSESRHSRAEEGDGPRVPTTGPPTAAMSDRERNHPGRTYFYDRCRSHGRTIDESLLINVEQSLPCVESLFASDCRTRNSLDLVRRGPQAAGASRHFLVGDPIISVGDFIIS